MLNDVDPFLSFCKGFGGIAMVLLPCLPCLEEWIPVLILKEWCNFVYWWEVLSEQGAP